jgi:hypothetical protein
MCRLVALARILVRGLIALIVFAGAMRASAQQADRKVSGLGIIDRVVVTGAEPVFQADGYKFRVTPTTEVRYGAGLAALSDVGTNTLVRFEGKRDGSGEIAATKVEFDKLKLPKRKTEAGDPQVTEIASGFAIDADKGNVAPAGSFLDDDEGGWCGWYKLPPDVAMQERVRRIGMRVVPKYQLELAADDRARIPFRFYVVEGTSIRSAIFCERGLVLVPKVAMERLTSDDLLAAVLADGVAGELQQQAEQGRRITLRDVGMIAAGAGAGAVAGSVPGVGVPGMAAVWSEQMVSERGVEHGRGRMALALMADAGYDPHQAPEAWRLMAPERLPKDLAKLKDPERSQYLRDFLKLQYDLAAPRVAVPQEHNAATQ